MAQKKLAWGYTTGTCAQAATKAAMQMLFTGEQADHIQVGLPNGEMLTLELYDIKIAYAAQEDRLPSSVSCAVKKDSGDDPDITDGVLVYSKVQRTKGRERVLRGGQGIGQVTKPGLEQPIGSPAINQVPRKMILQEVGEACEEAGYSGGIEVEISIPDGERLARKTFNPRLGITGGLSILGTSGRVEPMSEQALIDTIRLEIQVRMAGGSRHLVIAPGNYGLTFLRDAYGIEERAVIKCSNYIGQTLDMASEQGCKGILVAGHIGKLIKVAGGIMNTHSRWADCRMEILASAALRAGLSGKQSRRLLEAMTTDDALAMLSDGERRMVMEQVMGQIQRYLEYRAGEEMETGAVVFSNVYGILGKTDLADDLLRRAVADLEQDGKKNTVNDFKDY